MFEQGMVSISVIPLGACYPLFDGLLQDGQRQGAMREHFVMKLLQFELRSQRSLRMFTQRQYFQHANRTIPKSLASLRAVTGTGNETLCRVMP